MSDVDHLPPPLNTFPPITVVEVDTSIAQSAASWLLGWQGKWAFVCWKDVTSGSIDTPLDIVAFHHRIDNPSENSIGNPWSAPTSAVHSYPLFARGCSGTGEGWKNSTFSIDHLREEYEGNRWRKDGSIACRTRQEGTILSRFPFRLAGPFAEVSPTINRQLPVASSYVGNTRWLYCAITSGVEGTMTVPCVDPR